MSASAAAFKRTPRALAQALSSPLGLRRTPVTPSPFLLRQHQTPFLGGSRWASSIKFLGKDRWQGHASEPGPHPEAPKEFKDDFGSFHQKSIQDWTPPPQANAASSSGRGIEFWELPTRFQRSFLEEPEMACVESGGASFDMSA